MQDISDKKKCEEEFDIRRWPR